MKSGGKCGLSVVLHVVKLSPLELPQRYLLRHAAGQFAFHNPDVRYRHSLTVQRFHRCRAAFFATLYAPGLPHVDRVRHPHPFVLILGQLTLALEAIGLVPLDMP